MGCVAHLYARQIFIFRVMVEGSVVAISGNDAASQDYVPVEVAECSWI